VVPFMKYLDGDVRSALTRVSRVDMCPGGIQEASFFHTGPIDFAVGRAMSPMSIVFNRHING
jgi:hypothetical protein